MKIFKHSASLKKEILGNHKLSFVPTMGGLHKGHIYLIKKAKQKSNKVIVSIFVNPKQFNSKNDYKNYPRNLNIDLKILNRLKVNYVFIPNFKDIYSFITKKKIYLDKSSTKLCGKFRKNHFKGVLEVVNRFIELIKPRYVFLGEKDYQQLYLIQKHIDKRNIKLNIIKCKSIRETNGVVCSSRNKNLNKKEMLLASKIYKILKKNKKYLRSNSMILKVKNIILRTGVKKIEYLKALNLKTLIKPKSKKSKFNIFISYYINKVRLIDNL